MTHPLPAVDVIVPVYGKWELTRDCLRSLREQTVPHNVFVVDDAGQDETGAEVTAHFPEVTLITLETNSGFGTACNAGIRSGNAPFVVLLNNDAVAEPTFLEKLVAVFDLGETIGSVAPLVLGPDGRVQTLGFSVDPTLLSHHRYENTTTAELESPEYLLLGAYGAAAGYRRRALEDVGLFDERIFMYHEDLDLAVRLTSSGWLIAAAPESHVTHVSGATIGNGSKKQRRNDSFGRGYLIRAYGLLRTRYAVRLVATEAMRCVVSLLKDRDVIAISGRIKGWRSGAYAHKRLHPPLDASSIDRNITFASWAIGRGQDQGGPPRRHRKT